MLFLTSNVPIKYYIIMSRGRLRQKQAPPGSFGETLYNLRVSQNQSVIELANKVGRTPHYIRKLEEGDATPSPRLVRHLAGALDVLPIVLKLATGHVEFWDLYPVNFKQPPSGYSLSNIDKEEEIKLLWFLRYLRSVGV